MLSLLPLFIFATFCTAEGLTPTLSPTEQKVIDHLQEQHYNLIFAIGDISKSEFDHLYLVFPERLKARAKQNSSERQTVTLARYGQYQAPGKAMPYAFSKLANGQYRVNCTYCHAGMIPDPNGARYQVGMVNNRADVAAFIQDRMALRKKYPHYSTPGVLNKIAFPAFEKVMSQFPLSLNRGTSAVWKFNAIEASVRKPNMSLSLKGMLNLLRGKVNDFDTIAADVDPLPWWNSRFKERLWFDGWVPNEGRSLSINLTGPLSKVKQTEQPLQEFLNLISKLPIPKYPLVIDIERAARGKIAFEQKCSGCHGIYAADESVAYPNKTIPIDHLGTDPARLNEAMTVAYRTFVANSWLGDYGRASIRTQPVGYMPPVLRGVWATAPYFHNGSVPTLYGVLHPSERPAVWRSDTTQYDWEKVGIKVFTGLSAEEGIAADQQNEVFKTATYGKSNQGHLFVNSLEEEQKSDVLEYLKTL